MMLFTVPHRLCVCWVHPRLRGGARRGAARPAALCGGIRQRDPLGDEGGVRTELRAVYVSHV